MRIVFTDFPKKFLSEWKGTLSIGCEFNDLEEFVAAMDSVLEEVNLNWPDAIKATFGIKPNA